MFSLGFCDSSKLEGSQLALLLQNEYNEAMPPYFRFLTLMAFNFFVKEKVSYGYNVVVTFILVCR